VTELPLGEVFCTTEALWVFVENLDEEPNTFLARHANGDWGEVNDHDRKANEHTVKHGLRVLSVYSLRSGQTILVVTEGDRSKTTILLPKEY
jgi:hypothetical protein